MQHNPALFPFLFLAFPFSLQGGPDQLRHLDILALEHLGLDQHQPDQVERIEKMSECQTKAGNLECINV